ncbi:MAG: acetylglutamate kinase [Anaerolineae bacterium]|nr:acetylglutamate kinase [Anaerolineae bacterium]
MQPIVIKIGGHELDDEAFLGEMAGVIKGLPAPVVIVHGGGKEISNLQKIMGIEPRFQNGVRVTDRESLAIVEMVLGGTANRRLVRHLVNGGVEAQGMSGLDRGLIRAEKMILADQDMGFTGEVKAVRGEVLLEMLAQGITPVIAPICLGPDSSFNVNADHVAGAVAAAIGAGQVIFLTNVEGVLQEDRVVPALTPAQTHQMIVEGTIFGGMIPKVETALAVLTQGVPQAVITNLSGLRTHGGTVFSPESIPA